MKRQIIALHGGNTFASYDAYVAALRMREPNLEDMRAEHRGWKRTLREDLGEDFDVLLPSMPSKMNAKYLEWEIWFTKIVPLLADDVVFVGHSLGGIFFVKYLSENTFPKHIRGLFLVAAPFDTRDTDWSLADFVLPDSLAHCAEQTKHIFIYHSKDDAVVPFSHAEAYQAALPQATMHTFEDREHFNDEHFPEIVSDIKSLYD